MRTSVANAFVNLGDLLAEVYASLMLRAKASFDVCQTVGRGLEIYRASLPDHLFHHPPSI